MVRWGFSFGLRIRNQIRRVWMLWVDCAWRVLGSSGGQAGGNRIFGVGDSGLEVGGE